jgi:hypothetical protein
MESYGQSSNFIYDTWIDGCGDSNGVGGNGTGSCVSLETSNSYRGSQSMLFDYDNDDSQSISPNNYSETTLVLAESQDWTANGIRVLRVHFYGDPDNDANESERMYVALEDDLSNVSVVQYGGDANSVNKQQWQQWNIDLGDFEGVDLTRISRFHLGFGDRDDPDAAPGGSGTVWFDDIRLYGCRDGALRGDVTRDCVVDFRDVAVMAEEWLGIGSGMQTDLCEDGQVDLKDYSFLAGDWMEEQLWAIDDTPAGYEPGLAWVGFNSAAFDRPFGVGVDSQVDIDTGTSINDYSKIWLGAVKIPTNAKITFEAEADDGVRLWIGEECIIDGWNIGGERVGTFTGQKNTVVPLRLEYFQFGGEAAYLRLYWSWTCRQRELIGGSDLYHSESDYAWVQGVNNGEIPVQVYEDKSSIYEAGAEARNPMSIRPGPHLFIGDYLIESSQNIIREVKQPQRDGSIDNPVVTGWEDGCFQPYFSVVRDSNYEPNSFRIWYGSRTEDLNMGRSRIGYMESADGINWVRPAQIYEPFDIQFGCSVIDRGSAYPNSLQRYKFGYYYAGGLRIGVSPNGMDWQMLVPYTVVQHSHDINGIFWDPLLGCYVGTISQNMIGEKWSGVRRVTTQSFSDDLINWSMPWFVVTPDDSSDDGETQFYAMDGYLVRGPLRIGMVKVLRDDLVAEPPVDPSAYGIGYTALAWSLDGEHWVRDQNVFFDRDHNTSPVPWDHAHAWVDDQLIVGDEVYLYYGGYKQGHKVNRFEERQIGLVKMPLDRYVARKAEVGTSGTLLTVPLVMDDQPGRLVVNADASGGALRVQMRDGDSNDVISGLSFADCTSITSDGLAMEVRWGSEAETLQKLADLVDGTVRLEFELTDASLYAFSFVEP